ncbi:MAG: acylphosphatase [Niabella sp.]
METKKILIKGKVQGVFFRQSAKAVAQSSGVKGTVKNLPGGDTVEIIATARYDQLSILIDWCKHGPAYAVVSSIEIIDLPLTVFDDFSIV